MRRTSLAALLATVTIAACVSACASFNPFAPRVEAHAQCYWLSNVTNAWQAMPEADTRQRCYQLDSCSGGEGQSGGGCYKWTARANDPQNRW
jgi:hypothetical protein